MKCEIFLWILQWLRASRWICISCISNKSGSLSDVRLLMIALVWSYPRSGPAPDRATWHTLFFLFLQRTDEMSDDPHWNSMIHHPHAKLADVKPRIFFWCCLFHFCILSFEIQLEHVLTSISITVICTSLIGVYLEIKKIDIGSVYRRSRAILKYLSRSRTKYTISYVCMLTKCSNSKRRVHTSFSKKIGKCVYLKFHNFENEAFKDLK